MGAEQEGGVPYVMHSGMYLSYVCLDCDQAVLEAVGQSSLKSGLEGSSHVSSAA